MVANEKKIEVCITGMGWKTSLGSGLSNVWEKLISGYNGFVELPSEFPIRNNLCAIDSLIDEPNYRRRFDYLMISTLNDAAENSGLSVSELSAAKYVLGTSYGYNLDSSDVKSLSLWGNIVGKKLNINEKDIILISNACSTGTDCISVGAEIIKSGLSDICICGSADIITLSKRLGHSSLGTMSPTMIKPLDCHHDGMLLGEGAGSIVLESLQRANGRGAHIHAIYSGAGMSNDACGMTTPDSSGYSITLAVNRALKMSRLSRDDVDIVNVHGSGTILNDSVEIESLRTIFKSRKPVLFATKGALGHSLGATGIIEAIAVIQGLKNKMVPPICGLQNPISGAEFVLPIGSALQVDASVGMSITLGFGGFNSCIIFRVTD